MNNYQPISVMCNISKDLKKYLTHTARVNFRATFVCNIICRLHDLPSAINRELGQILFADYSQYVAYCNAAI